MDKKRSVERGFTLIELLVALAIVSILASLLTPVFVQAREKGRQAACLSNVRQLSIAILQYTQDNDETFPDGTEMPPSGWIWQGEGWIGQCDAYLKSPDLARCGSDPTPAVPLGFPVSYGYNINFVQPPEYFFDTPGGMALSALTAPTKSVLLFEVANVSANLAAPGEGAWTGTVGPNFSPSGNGLDNRLYAQTNDTTSSLNQYATGYLGGRLPANPAATQFQSAAGRHSGGSNYAFGDGHARWMRGEQVSSGIEALDTNCSQDNSPATPVCMSVPGSLYAAGTQSSFGATFSTR